MKKVLLSVSLALYALAASAATLTPIQLISPAGSASGQVITSTGASTAPAWGNVSASTLAAQAANTVLANVTASSASPTAFAMPSCSTSTSALQYTIGTGFTCYASSATTTGTLAQFAATTSVQLAGVLSDETGSGAAVFGTSPTIGTPTINTPTISGGTINNATLGITTPLAAKVTTLQATSAITPAYPAGIIGNVSGSAISAGSIGETICAQVTNGGSPTGCASNVSTPVSLTTATSANVASITLTAGDWDIFANVSYNIGATTTVNYVGASISSASVTMDYNAATLVPGIAGSVATVMAIPAPTIHKSISSTTTFYLVTTQAFGTSTLSAFGKITAVRR